MATKKYVALVNLKHPDWRDLPFNKRHLKKGDVFEANHAGNTKAALEAKLIKEK